MLVCVCGGGGGGNKGPSTHCIAYIMLLLSCHIQLWICMSARLYICWVRGLPKGLHSCVKPSGVEGRLSWGCDEISDWLLHVASCWIWRIMSRINHLSHHNHSEQSNKRYRERAGCWRVSWRSGKVLAAWPRGPGFDSGGTTFLSFFTFAVWKAIGQ